MGRHNVTGITGNHGTSFQPVGDGSETNRVSPSRTGYPSEDTLSDSNTRKEGSCCCPAQDRLSNWFSGLSGIGKALFVLGSIFSVGLLYIGALIKFACTSEDKNS